MPFSKVSYIFIIAALLSTTNLSSETRYYPEPSSKLLEVGKEEFRDGYISLRGLEGIFVDLETLMSAGEDKGISVPESLSQQIRDKIESAGLFFLTKDEMLQTPGQPIMNLWPTYDGEPEHSDAQDSRAAVNACEIPVSCRNSLWAGVKQSASLLRQPENLFQLSTWGDGEESNQCEDRGQWMADAVLRKVDLFVSDFIKAQQDPDPIVVSKSEDIPSHCAQSWVTYLHVFATNATKINDHIKPILNQFVDIAERCNTYNYIIETHADQRAEAAYNKLLTEARARSVKDYLLSQGMQYQRLKMRPLGESQPIANGDSAADHAKNRRVIIRPVNRDEYLNTQLDF